MMTLSPLPKLAFFIPTLGGGGAERVTLNLAGGFAEAGYPVEVIVASASGRFLEQVPAGVTLVDLGVKRVLSAVVPLARHLRRQRVDFLFPQMRHANVVALLAKVAAGTKTVVCPVEHNTLSAARVHASNGRDRLMPILMRWLYPLADRVIAVSAGVAADLEQTLDLRRGHVATIYNPVVDRHLTSKAAQPLSHPWFTEGAPPVFLALGRLTYQKSFSTLIEAFDLFQRHQDGRLLILGEGEDRPELEGLVARLGLADVVSLPGFVENPYPYLTRASVFVLSSRWEGLPTVLIEAMACGCPVVSTDCPSGPREILDGGRLGGLVPIEDVYALSQAMTAAFTQRPAASDLITRSQAFTLDQTMASYERLMTSFQGVEFSYSVERLQ